MNKAFSSTKLNGLVNMFKEKAEMILGPINAVNGKVKDFHAISELWSLEVMCRFAFGYDGGANLGPDVSFLFKFFYEALAVANFWQYWEYLTFLPSVKKMNKCRKTIRTVVEDMVKQRRQKGVDPDDIDLLAELLRGDEEGKIDNEILVQNCNQMIIAGDTTSSAMTTIMYYLATYPQVQEKLRKEILLQISGDEDYTVNEVSKCDYLHMVIKEVLRVAPPVRAFVSRTSTEDLSFSGFKIPVGSQVCYCTIGVHHNEKYWEDPLTFKPERWENKDSIHPMAWFPFLGGNRNCIGQSMAMLEMKTTLIELLKRYTVSLGDPNYKLKWTVSWVSCPTDLALDFTPLK